MASFIVTIVEDSDRDRNLVERDRFLAADEEKELIVLALATNDEYERLRRH